VLDRLHGADGDGIPHAKVTDYLLNITRMPVAAKARFFFSCGVTSDEWPELARALKVHGQTQPVVGTTVSAYGAKHEIEGPLRCPDGRSPMVRSVWQIDKDELAPRLITAYPVLERPKNMPM
jgi:hypothetical protein